MVLNALAVTHFSFLIRMHGQSAGDRRQTMNINNTTVADPQSPAVEEMQHFLLQFG